jgi:hypothetical protein
LNTRLKATICKDLRPAITPMLGLSRRLRQIVHTIASATTATSLNLASPW